MGKTKIDFLLALKEKERNFHMDSLEDYYNLIDLLDSCLTAEEQDPDLLQGIVDFVHHVHLNQCGCPICRPESSCEGPPPAQPWEDVPPTERSSQDRQDEYFMLDQGLQIMLSRNVL